MARRKKPAKAKRRTLAKAPTAKAPSSLKDFAGAPYNPRAISEQAVAGLARSLHVFGDLSGIVWNEATGHIICGHQRRAALADADMSAIAWGEVATVTLGHDGARFDSVERLGTFTAPGGARFTVRRVAWEPIFEKAANISANNPAIQGAFTSDLRGLLDEIKAEDGAMFDDLALGVIDLKTLRGTSGSSGKDVDPGVQKYAVEIECTGEAMQKYVYEHCVAEGWTCRILTL